VCACVRVFGDGCIATRENGAPQRGIGWHVTWKIGYTADVALTGSACVRAWTVTSFHRVAVRIGCAFGPFSSAARWTDTGSCY
jgi:hypothetical protein